MSAEQRPSRLSAPQIRALAALLVALAVWYFTAGIGRTSIALASGSFFVALLRAAPNIGLGRTFAIMGCAILVGALVPVYLHYGSLSSALLLSDSVSVIYTGSIAIGYAFVLCGLTSIAWGAGMRSGAGA